jgi:hypothetical protein
MLFGGAVDIICSALSPVLPVRGGGGGGGLVPAPEVLRRGVADCGAAGGGGHTAADAAAGPVDCAEVSDSPPGGGGGRTGVAVCPAMLFELPVVPPAVNDFRGSGTGPLRGSSPCSANTALAGRYCSRVEPDGNTECRPSRGMEPPPKLLSDFGSDSPPSLASSNSGSDSGGSESSSADNKPPR